MSGIPVGYMGEFPVYVCNGAITICEGDCEHCLDNMGDPDEDLEWDPDED